ncbi:hypothetical protein JCM11491_005200 [Sporobolomyces phaffii]
MSDDDGFVSVSYKKPTRAPKNRKGKNRFRERTLDEKLAAREAALHRSGYLAKCIELVRTSISSRSTDNAPSTSACPAPTRVVCLGLGSVSDSTKAQDQYILLKELLVELGPLIDARHPVQFYDPVFSPEDAAFLTGQGHTVLSSEFPLRLDSPTLLYIPHGPRPLFDSLVELNWSAARLSNVILLGNRLDLYDDPTYSGTTSQSSGAGGNDLGPELRGGIEWIRKATPLFNIVPLPTTKDHLEAFNDLALEWVEPSRIDKAVEEGLLPRGGESDPTPDEHEGRVGRDDDGTDRTEHTTETECDENPTPPATSETERALEDSVEALETLHLSTPSRETK